MPPASVLSPLATPFVPSYQEYQEYVQESFSSVYLNGMPSLVYVGDKPEREVLHNISDDAIDEAFPPGPEDAAELDAVDDFIDTLVDLSFLEDREERSRNTFDFVQKRWEARRGEGLKGKPHPARSILIDLHSRSANARHTTTLTKMNNVGKLPKEYLETRPRTKYAGKHIRTSGLKGYQKPIQQPRKHC